MKAQLIIVGGRAPIPNMLTIKHQCPDVVITVSSGESRNELPQLEKVIHTICSSCRIEHSESVDAFDFALLYNVCEKAIMRYPDADWIFNITTGTTIMSLAAYEVARKYQQSMSIRCWYINTSRTRVIAFPEDESLLNHADEIFDISVLHYAKAYNHDLLPGELEHERGYAEANWLPFAHRLGKNPEDVLLLKKILKKIGNNKPGKDKDGEDRSRSYSFKDLPSQAYTLLADAQRLQLVSQLSRDESSIHFRLSSYQFGFLNGCWLEMYVWNEARKLHLFDDCQWNYIFKVGNSQNELDVAMTYKAQLLAVECKTGEKEAYDSDTLYKLDSVANVLGGRFVSRLLVTSLPWPGEEQKFKERAASRRIVVVMADDLPRIGELLKKEAEDPTYPRM